MGFGLVTGEIGESGAANALRGVRLLGSLAYLGRSERGRRRKLAEAIYSVEGAQRMRLKTNLCCRTESGTHHHKGCSLTLVMGMGFTIPTPPELLPHLPEDND